MNALSIKGANPGKLHGLCYDSREAKRGSTFVAIKGDQVDGHDYIAEAIRNGATTLVVERQPKVLLPKRVTVIKVPDTRIALSMLADYYYDSPSTMLKAVGVTGTNGKTTVVHLLNSVFSAAGAKCGQIGTIEYDIAGEIVPAVNTTPQSLDLHLMMNTMVKKKADYCLMEVSSHALVQYRVEDVEFHSALFTNLTQDHLDYHEDMDDYFRAKARLFVELNPGVSIINADDPYSAKLMSMIGGDVITYGLEPDCDINADDIAIDATGISMTVHTPGGSFPLQSPLIGQHNVYNILATVGLAHAEGISQEAISKGISQLKIVRGRFQKIDEGQPFTVVVDYAHTADALANALGAARPLAKGKVITVFGCGGDRDRTKRPLMGATAWTRSDVTIVTSDNPRTENPESIIKDVLQGIQSDENPDGVLKVEPDRRIAIRTAIALAKPGDFVMIAGKGHEDYQIVGKTKEHFDDREEAEKVIKEVYGKVLPAGNS